MKYLKYFLSILILLQLNACKDKMELSDTQANGFIKYFGGNGFDEGKDVIQTSDGGYALLGTITDNSEVRQVAFYKTNEFGNIQWKVITDSVNHQIGNSFIIDNEGNYVIVGTSTIDANNTDILLMKISNTGLVSWSENYGGIMNQEGRDLILNKNDSILISYLNEGNTYMLRTTYEGDSVDYVSYLGNTNSIYKLSSDNYIVLGAANNKIVFINVRANGKRNVIVFVEVNGSEAMEMQPLSTGNYIVVGTAPNGNNSDIFLTKIKYDLTVVDGWAGGKFFGGNSDDYGNSVKVTENDDIIIFGTSDISVESGNDMYLIKTDSEGNEIFTKTYGGTGNETGSKIELTTDGGFIMIGSSEIEGNSMICLIKTDSEGNIGE